MILRCTGCRRRLDVAGPPATAHARGAELGWKTRGDTKCPECIAPIAPASVNVMASGTGWPPDDLTPRQREVLGIVAEFDCESWGDAWIHCEWPGVLAFANFGRVADALVRRKVITEGDRLEVTDFGRQILRSSK